MLRFYEMFEDAVFDFTKEQPTASLFLIVSGLTVIGATYLFLRKWGFGNEAEPKVQRNPDRKPGPKDW